MNKIKEKATTTDRAICAHDNLLLTGFALAFEAEGDVLTPFGPADVLAGGAALPFSVSPPQVDAVLAAPHPGVEGAAVDAAAGVAGQAGASKLTPSTPSTAGTALVVSLLLALATSAHELVVAGPPALGVEGAAAPEVEGVTTCPFAPPRPPPLPRPAPPAAPPLPAPPLPPRPPRPPLSPPAPLPPEKESL